MKKHLKTIKTIFITVVLLTSLFAVLMPTISAGLLKNKVTLLIELTDVEAANKKIVPLNGSMSVPVRIGYLVSGLFAQSAIALFKSRNVVATISLSVEETPPWCTAIIQPNVVSPEITDGWSYKDAFLKISFQEEAPAMAEVKIKVKMQAEGIPGILFQINEETEIGEVSFTPGYLPIISVTTPQGNFQEISPGEVARFNIDIENMGNAKTVVDFTILNFPKGWDPNIISSTTIDENSKTTVQLIIQPPYEFGYHNDREQVQIKIIPSYFADSTKVGRIYTETFTIQSRGFSTPGFEAAFVMIALIGMGFLIRKRKKTI